MGGNDSANKTCGLGELIVFVAAIIAGTACSIWSKTMMELRAEGIGGEEEVFNKPIFQTLGMFVGMCFGLVMHVCVQYFKIPFPGYFHDEISPDTHPTETSALLKASTNQGEPTQEKESLPVWMYFFLAIPAVFDLAATALCMMGLQHIDVSIYQLLRGSGIIFVALMKQHVLGDRLYNFQWIGVLYNVVSVFLVGGTAILNESGDEETSGQALLGVLLVIAGALVQSLQFIFEEKVMTMEIPSPPLLLIGMEGLWGTFFCVTIVYPLVTYLPGDDHGSYEDVWNTIYMVKHSTVIQQSFIVYFFSIFLYNFFAVLVTYMLNSVWHAILDNFRPITVWGTDLFIFYVLALPGDFGEQWTPYSWIQVAGMIVLGYGTAIYNAPNSGSVRLEGEWFNLFLDYSKEYKEILEEGDEESADATWEERMESFKTRTESSFYGEHSPHVSVHTQALRGLASPKL